jgi:hypothetical protein
MQGNQICDIRDEASINTNAICVGLEVGENRKLRAINPGSSKPEKNLLKKILPTLNKIQKFVNESLEAKSGGCVYRCPCSTTDTFAKAKTNLHCQYRCHRTSLQNPKALFSSRRQNNTRCKESLDFWSYIPKKNSS